MAESAGFGISAGCVVREPAPGKRLPASYSVCQDFPESVVGLIAVRAPLLLYSSQYKQKQAS
jgi:hypothetical protein